MSREEKSLTQLLKHTEQEICYGTKNELMNQGKLRGLSKVVLPLSQTQDNLATKEFPPKLHRPITCSNATESIKFKKRN